jgi:hypothetical protein
MPTIKTIKMLEQCIIDQYNAGPWSRGDHTLGEESQDEDVNMSIIPAGCKGQDDWTFEEASPSHCLVSNSKKPLDWGLDAELKEYVCLPSLYPMFNKHLASLQCPSRPRGLKGGSCRVDNAQARDSLIAQVNIIYTLCCKHGQSFAMCNRCKGKSPSNGTLWLLDLGVLMHFMHEMSNFTEYTPAKLSEHIPINTVSKQIHVEGQGTVLVKHKVDNKLVTTCLHPMYYIPKISMWLLSMRQFLKDGMSVLGDHCHLSLYQNK